MTCVCGDPQIGTLLLIAAPGVLQLGGPNAKLSGGVNKETDAERQR